MNLKNNFTMQEVEEFWDRVAGIYDKCNNEIRQIYYQRFKKSIEFFEFSENDKILNIWSRTGVATEYLRNKGRKLDITNAEVSAEMIRLARKRYPAERFEKVDLLKLPYSGNYFDGILSLETIEHVQYPTIFLKELFRVLKPQGKLVLSTPPATAEFALKIYNLIFKHHGEGPHKFISSKVMKKLLSEAGFKLIKHQGTLLLPVNLKFIRDFGELVIKIYNRTFINEFGIRQFYVCVKQA